MIEVEAKWKEIEPRIMVIGVGGGGNNAVDRMVEAGLMEVSFAAVNTDLAVLNNSKAEQKIQIGSKLLSGYGAGADPSLGEAAAQESEEELSALVEGYDMVILTCGMGGGTGTGACPVIAKICKEKGILTVAVVTLPFFFEGNPRLLAAQNGMEKLKSQVDTILTIPNDKLLRITEKQLMLEDAFMLADSVLRYTIEGISNIVFNRGTVNIDFNDVKTTLRNKGEGHLGIGMCGQDGSILDAVKQAVNSPLLETTIQGAENILLNTEGRINLITLNEAVSYVKELAGGNVNVLWGTVTSKDHDPDKIVVTLIATGLQNNKTEKMKTSREEFLMEKKRPIIETRIHKPQNLVFPPFMSDYMKK